MATNAILIQELTTHLASKSLTPTPTWLTTFLSTQRPNAALASTKQTALFRLLTSDFRTSLHSSPPSLFPPDILNAGIRERNLAGPIPVQVIDVDDMGKSRWSQVEDLEAAERGETQRGREIIRVTAGEDQAPGTALEDAAAPKSSGPHKLTLQDARGACVFAIEMVSVAGLGTGMSVGCKMVLRNVTVARGVVLLHPGSVSVLGGKIEAMDGAWKRGRKEALRAGIGNVGAG